METSLNTSATGTAKTKKTQANRISAGDPISPREGLNGPDPALMKKQSGIWNLLMDRYFHLELHGWPTANNTVFAVRDANIDNLRVIDMWIKLGQSQNVAELVDTLKLIGNPLFHTLAADRNGDRLYSEISAIPNITQLRVDDQDYVDAGYEEIEATIQASMDKLATRRKFPIFG